MSATIDLGCALRILYATPWDPWTLVEALDEKRGRHFKKA
jgi:hypothetical protein